MSQRGTFVNGDLQPVQSQDALVRGATYEVTGSVSGFMMQVLPENWLALGLEQLYELKNSDVNVTAVELNADGSFRMQVTPNNYQMAGIGIAIAITAGVAITILAGMQVEQIFQVVTGTGGAGGGGPVAQAVSLITIGAVIALGLYVWSEYRKASS